MYNRINTRRVSSFEIYTVIFHCSKYSLFLKIKWWTHNTFRGQRAGVHVLVSFLHNPASCFCITERDKNSDRMRTRRVKRAGGKDRDARRKKVSQRDRMLRQRRCIRRKMTMLRGGEEGRQSGSGSSLGSACIRKHHGSTSASHTCGRR